MPKFDQDWLLGLGISQSYSFFINQTLVIAGVLILSYLANLIARKVLLVRLARSIQKSSFKWDDVFLEKRVFKRLFHIVPALVIYFFASLLPSLEEWIERIALTYMMTVGLLALDSFLSACVDIYSKLEISTDKPIKGYVQVLKIFLYAAGGIFILATLLDRSPWGFLSGLGAMTTVLLLVFKDSILGLVASFQFSSNKMVSMGDWIEMPKYGVDGDVIDISLHTVKVQNWDKTITTIPTYALLSDSFKNWSGMQKSGGRRIKRAVYIDMNSIKFCTEEMLQRFEQFHHIKGYIRSKRDEIGAYNKAHNIGPNDVSGRRITNIGTFRAYISGYLKNHPKIHNDMTFLVRHLALTEHGLPIEIYVFSNDQVWANYEAIQADIFDHILAVVPEFELRVFQSPAGYDLGLMTQKNWKGTANKNLS